MTFTCPFCNQSLEADDGLQGMQFDCPSCNRPFIVPSMPAAIPVVESAPVQSPRLPKLKRPSAPSAVEQVKPDADRKEGRTVFQRLGRGIYICATVLVLLIAGTVGKEIAGVFITKTSSRGPAFTPSWKTQEWGSMLLEVPAEIKPCSVKMSPQQQSAIRKAVETVYAGRLTTDSFELAVSRALYSSAITPNLDGAAQAIVAQIAGLPGVSNPLHQITTTTISGLPARRVEFTAQRQVGSRTATLRVVGFVVLLGQESYSVHCFYQGGDVTAEDCVDRILKSVRFQQSP